MIYNLKQIDEFTFNSQLSGLGREVESYYTHDKDRVLVEPNGSYDGGKIYCKADSWIKRGDIIKLSGNWYVVSQLSNLASDIFNVGSITMCDVTLRIRMGYFAYDVPCVASKYSGNSNARGIIDDSIDGQLNFITGYHEEFDQLTDNPAVTVFGKVWQIGNYLNVNNVMTVYCKGMEVAPNADLCISEISTLYNVGDTFDFDVYVLYTTKDAFPDDLRIQFSSSCASAKRDGNKYHITCEQKGSFNIMLQSKKMNAYYQTPEIYIV